MYLLLLIHTSTYQKKKERPVSTWEELKTIIKKMYAPKHYYRELFNRLQMITQGNKSVEEYQKELEVAMIRANVNENQIQLKKGYEEKQHVSAKMEEQKDLAKMEKQAEQHGE